MIFYYMVMFPTSTAQRNQLVPEVDQVFATQPVAFKEKYPTTYCIIDASEVFVETPSDLFMQ